MKRIITFLAIAAFAGIAEASELWWTVSGTYNSSAGTYTTKVDDENVSWTTARLMANTTGYNYGDNDTVVATGFAPSELADFSMFTTDISSYSSSSFYVELLNGSNEVVGRSYISKSGTQQGAASTSVLAGSIYNNAFDSAGVSPYEFIFTTSEVIPEPTSGLLIFLGVVLLGLKRKQA